ncbi:L-type lectin family protein [Myroides odoratimimus]|uniref:lectin-like domain-containing protein n=1 Tax=Myroides odoratimimus TaxID=76832 RepID=UPI0013B35C1B|nr:hypothetical protein [Myroides odoratimimus]
MRKLLIYIYSLTFVLLCSYKVLAQYPYQNTLKTEDDFTQFSSSKVSFDKYGATLTPATTSTTRGFYLNDLAFTIERGFIIEFDYLMTGGSGFADGLALVLFDGNESKPIMGAAGAGLGYSYKTPNGGGGLTKGFLAVGIDLWGNFKYRRSEDGDYRNGIRDGGDNNTLIGGKANEVKNHVTIRGQGNGGKGYPVLITQSTVDFESRTQLNFETGLFDIKPEKPQSDPFSFKLRESTSYNENDINAAFGHPSYRRVQISMLPGEKFNDVGFYMSVDIIHGTIKSRVIKDYFLPKKTEIKYMEATAKANYENKIEKLTLEAPQTFKIGFTASTGGFTQRHIVRNLSLYMPFSPSIQNLYLTDICKDTPTEIDILSNSVGFKDNKYQGQGSIHDVGKKEYLDPYSFQFRVQIEGLYEDTSNPYTAVTEYGTYEYDPKTMKAIFTPAKGVTMPEFDEVYFTIKNKEKVLNDGLNIGNEQFRSNTGVVRLTFGNNCNDVLMVNGNAI